MDGSETITFTTGQAITDGSVTNPFQGSINEKYEVSAKAYNIKTRHSQYRTDRVVYQLLGSNQRPHHSYGQGLH